MDVKNDNIMSQSIKRNFVYNTLLNVSSVIFPLITAPYVARVLEPNGVGLFNFIISYAGYFSLFAVLGIPTYGVREVAKLRGNQKGLQKLVSELISIAFISTFFVSVAYILTIIVIGKLSENSLLFLVAGITIYFAPFKINWYYQGLEKFGFITFRSIVVRTLSVICLFLFVKGKSDLIIYITINALGGFLADLWNYIKMWKSGVHPFFTIKGLIPHLKPLWFLFASTIAISIYTVLDTLMLGFIKDYSEVGYYNNASHITKSVLMVITSLSTVSIPRFSYYIKNKEIGMANSLTNKCISFVLFLAFPLCAGLMCIAPVFVPWFFGEHFYGAIIPLMIMSLLLIAIGISNITGIQIMVGMGLDKYFLRTILIGTILNFTMNCIFIPLMGANGASISSVIAEFSISGVMLYVIYTRTQIRINVWKDALKSFIGAILFFPLLWIVPKDLPALLYIILFSGLCGVVYWFSQQLLKNQTLLNFQESTLSIIKNKISV